MTERLSFTASDGLEIAYYIDDFTDPWTVPTTLVLLHSAMGNSERFYSWVPGLARHFRVVRMDLRGHGRSAVPAPDVALSMDRFVRDVEECMDAVGATQAHIVANSAGGYLAQKLAITKPDRVLGLCVVGSTPGLSPSALDWLPLIEKEGLTPFLTRTIAMRFDLESTDPGMVRWFLEQTAENDPAYVARFIGYMATQEWSGDLPRIKSPTLRDLSGRRDRRHRQQLRHDGRAHPRREDDRVPAHAAQHRRHDGRSLRQRHPGLPVGEVRHAEGLNHATPHRLPVLRFRHLVRLRRARHDHADAHLPRGIRRGGRGPRARPAEGARPRSPAGTSPAS